ncbi:shikimate dehydrogenase [Zooshikella sp. RANM57]|uniref:shikimate dehydrogenase n=1 Tax=Zooshikella sp. RANM57 TaxID=3425863 RepID=UPI003D6E3B99
MTTVEQKKQYGVFGNPINHSKSPTIHTLFAKQTQQQLQYDAFCIEIDQFNSAVGEFFTNNGGGLNVTVPFKEAAFKLADNLTDRASQAGAVNTLWQDQQGRLWGDNTDGVGLVRDIQQNHHYALQDKRILVIGAGGAVRGVMAPLLETDPQSITIANRTHEKAEQLACLFQAFGRVTAQKLSSLASLVESDGPFDLVINGTAASLAGELPPLPKSLIGPNTLTYDMMYGPTLTVFNQWAKDVGGNMQLDGLGMLVEQAAESFYCWRGIRPDTQSVIRQLLCEMQGT